ncbi:protein ALP1-like [Ixodes scapularis]|uniref:protein ALP1-like n=1 Tax=Ixodes scapularis TaxID=6945 RepID=UPI001A9EFB27|nr:protein ALP1-like [Ixodes scapularis]
MATCVFEDPLALAVLRWDEIEELSFLDMEYPVPRRFRSGRGYLDVLNIDSEAFRHQFRFEQMDLMELCSALRVPHTIRTAQNVAIPGQEALCILLRRLSYPNRLCDLEGMFGRHSSTLSSATTVVLNHLTSMFGQLTADLSAHTWLNRASLDEFSEAVRAKGAPLQNCWGFVDGTARPICRPTEDQRLYFSGHKRVHAIKYQGIMCANGIIVEMNGPYPGHRHDAGILRLSGLYERLEDLAQGSVYTIYGDPAYPLRPLLQKPFMGASLTAAEQNFNKKMSSVRQAVEWGFGKVSTLFAFVDFKKKSEAQAAARERYVSGCNTVNKLPHVPVWQPNLHVLSVVSADAG